MARRNRIAQFALFVTISTIGESAFAGKLMDYIRNYDLNDYALGVSISGSQNPYAGAENSTIAYPFLTSFRDSAFTRDWLLLRDGDVGIRWVSESEWELGLVGRLQTLGFGTSQSFRLIGLDDRKWGLEMGPIVGYRAWPVHINFKAYTEIFGRHEGVIGNLALSLPMEGERGYFVPAIGATYQTADYNEYYYGVTPDEAILFRPTYQPGSSLSPELTLRWGYALTDRWLLSGSLGLEFLNSAITESPIVDRDELFSASISIAYNNDLFQPRVSDRPPPEQPRVEIRFGAFFDSIDSIVVRNAADGAIGTDIDLESLLGLSDEETLANLDVIYRIGTYHRIEFGYLGADRSGQKTLERTIEFGDQVFPAGTTIHTSFDTSIYRLGYAYSLINDPQKELGVMGGVHYSKFKTEVVESDSGQREVSNAATPLPVIGLHGSVALGQKSRLGARIQFFRMDFHSYEGSLNFATLDWQRRFGESLRLGIGYNYYAFNLESRENDVRGTLEVRHHGPEVFFNMAF